MQKIMDSSLPYENYAAQIKVLSITEKTEVY